MTRRRLTLSVLVALLLAMLLAAPARAAQGDSVAHVEISVSIKHGGTATLEPLDGAPAPTTSALTLANGEVGRFQMDFAEVGEFAYKLSQVPGNKNLVYDTTPYTVKVYVVNSDDGGIGAAVNVYNDKTGEKVDGLSQDEVWAMEACEINFVNVAKASDEPDNPPSEGGDNPLSSNGSGLQSASTPKTGDSGLVERYFVQAMLAAFGLLVLSLVYLRNTLKLRRGAAASKSGRASMWSTRGGRSRAAAERLVPTEMDKQRGVGKSDAEEK